MADLRKAFISGRLTSAPEIKTLANSDLVVCNFSVANKRKATKNNPDAATDFFDCTAFGSTAEYISKYFNKGDNIFIDAELQMQTYTRDDGITINKIVFKVTDVFFGAKKQNSSTSTTSTISAKPTTSTTPVTEVEGNANFADDEFEEYTG